MKKTLMLVDDEPELLEVLSCMLESDYYIVTAGDYDDAVTCLKEKKINGVITDLNLPNGTGIDLIKFIAGNYPSIPSSLITGDTSPRVSEEALSGGANSCFGKPFNSKKLFEIARALIEENKKQLDLHAV